MMTEETKIKAENLEKNKMKFQEILSDEELEKLFKKHGVRDERRRKLHVKWFFWLMVFSSSESSQRGSLLQLIGFFIGAMVLLYPEEGVMSLSKVAVCKKLKGVTWYLFRGVYNHLLNQYQKILESEEVAFLSHFKKAFAIDGSVISVSNRLEKVFESVHKGQASLKLNTKYCLKVAAVTKLQVTSGKRHDSRFAFVTQEANCLYIVDLGYWSFKLMQKVMDAGSFFVMRLKRNCDPLIHAVSDADYAHLIGKRLSEIGHFLDTQIPAGCIDLTVQLSKAKKPRFKENVRLVGLYHEAQWRFYVSNITTSSFTPTLIYELYAQRWQVEIFFNLIKNVLDLNHIISRTKNGIMVEIYSALIYFLFVRIVIALAAQQSGRSIHEFSFERSHKLIRGFMLSHFYLFLQPSLQSVELAFQHLISMISALGLRSNIPRIIALGHPPS